MVWVHGSAAGSGGGSGCGQRVRAPGFALGPWVRDWVHALGPWVHGLGPWFGSMGPGTGSWVQTLGPQLGPRARLQAGG